MLKIICNVIRLACMKSVYQAARKHVPQAEMLISMSACICSMVGLWLTLHCITSSHVDVLSMHAVKLHCNPCPFIF